MEHIHKHCRVHDKKKAFYHCSKLYPKVGCHLFNVHTNEIEVSKALHFRPYSKERKKQLDKIRNMRNYHRNIQVLETGVGELIVAR